MTTTAPAPGSISVEGRIHPIGDRARLIVGSDDTADVVVFHPLVFGHHLTIEWRGDRWHLIPAEQQARVLLAGRPSTDVPVEGVTQVHLGDAATGPALVVALEEPVRPAAAVEQRRDGNATQGGTPAVALTGTVTLGRTAFNDVVVDDMLVSRAHARISCFQQAMVIEDLGSANGTFVDGARVQHATISDGSTITLGNTDFVVDGGVLRPGSRLRDDFGLQVRGIGLIVDQGKELLRDVEFSAAPGTLTAVIGPSGAGKSTVSKVIAGLGDPTSGQVTFDGHDVHAEYDALRTRIGMVPQQDVIHGKLTLRQALRFAAEIRLPADLSEADRDHVIAGVLGELQLTEHLDTRIDTLSGGQRKRASVAMELLTGPSLLLLDEPTSGLDPALDRQVMASLRRLADAGRVVIVVTHSLAYLGMCDQVLLLAPGGKTAFRGHPSQVPAAMGSADWAQIFAQVAARPEEVHRDFLVRSRHEPRLRPVVNRRPAPLVDARRPSAAHQASTVARRQVRLIFADRGYLLFLAIMPVVLGLLTFVIPGSAGFGVSNDPDTAGEAVQLLVVLTIGAVFMGTAVTVRDLVAEQDVYHRERAVGLRPGAYLSAKVAVFTVVAVLQTVAMVAITYLGKGVPTGGVVGAAPLELLLAVAATAAVSTLVGLAISATVRSAEQTMPPLVIVVIAQLVFCGGLFRLTAPVVSQLSWLFPSYWGYAGAAMAVDLPEVAPLAPQTKDASLWEPSLVNGVLAASSLLLISTVLIAYTAVKLRK